MELRHEQVVRSAPESLRRLAADPARWAEWLPGLLALDTDGPEAVLRLRAPRVLRLRLVVEPTDLGVRWSLVEGDLPAVQGRLEAAPHGEGALLSWQVDVEFPAPLPGPLARELESEVLARWTEALAAAASGEEGGAR